MQQEVLAFPGRNHFHELGVFNFLNFRVNGDKVLAQHRSQILFVAQQLQGFAQDVQAPPLRAHVFIERAHYFAKDAQLPPNHFCINLRYGPFTPVVCQAFVDEGSAPGLDLKPLSGWGEPPKAVVLVLKRKEFAGQPAIVVDQFICANWLQAYPKAPPPVN